jgi:hypothetical protein
MVLVGHGSEWAVAHLIGLQVLVERYLPTLDVRGVGPHNGKPAFDLNGHTPHIGSLLSVPSNKADDSKRDIGSPDDGDFLVDEITPTIGHTTRNQVPVGVSWE